MTRRADGERRGRMLRRVLLSCLAAAAAGLLWDGVPRECRDAVAGSATVSLCGPIGVADLRVGLFLLVAGALLLGEAGEVQVAGLLTLKARVAEVKAEAADARREIAELRLAASAVSTASANTNVTIVNRLKDTGTAAQLAQDGELPVPGSTVRPLPGSDDAPGAFAVAAFGVGFSGLRSLLPEWASNAAVMGFAVDPEGAGYTPQAVSRGTEAESNECAALLAEHLGTSLLDTDPARWLAAVSVLDDDGRRMGALAVAVHDPPPPPGPGGLPGGPDDEQELEAAVELLGPIYARLLIDLLGEHAPSSGDDAREGGT